VWRPVRGDEFPAELVVTGGDSPWLNARVRPAAGFAEVRPLFDDELVRICRIADISHSYFMRSSACSSVVKLT
jgi:hypothetical protein